LSSLDPRIITIVVVGIIGFVLLFVVLPFVGRLSLVVEALSLLSEPLGDLTGNPRILLLGCVVLVLTVAGCCIITFVVVGSLLTCGSPNPSGLCRLIGR
jgi:hypothetical protein